MMKANELRIGNKLQKETGEIFTVLRLDNTNDVLVEEQRGLLTLGYNLLGIPLTPEILERIGFKFINSPNEYGWLLNVDNRQLCWCHSEFMSLEFKRGQCDEYSDVIFDFPCKHLHQLQNLYFALTNEELKVQVSDTTIDHKG